MATNNHLFGLCPLHRWSTRRRALSSARRSRTTARSRRRLRASRFASTSPRCASDMQLPHLPPNCESLSLATRMIASTRSVLDAEPRLHGERHPGPRRAGVSPRVCHRQSLLLGIRYYPQCSANMFLLNHSYILQCLNHACMHVRIAY